MTVEILEKTEETLKIIIRGIDEVIANTVRRTIISEVPTLAFKTISFNKNESAMYDEILAHRIGLLPIRMDKKTFKLPETKEDEDKPTSSIIFTLKEVGEKTVYASDLKSKDAKAADVAFPNTPLVKLLKGQKLELDAKAVVGTAKDHVKHSPGLVYVQELPIITIKEGADIKKIEKLLPGKLRKKNLKISELKDPIKWVMEGYCEEVIESDLITVEPSTTDFILTVESWGNLAPKDLLTQALDIISKKCSEFEKQIVKIK
tara:strand:- start:9 stop:791 length:783 start_codon:yes stop_codon:yes gene_type:complete